MKLKSLFFFSLLVISVTGYAQKNTDKDKSINWITIEEAQKLGKKNPRKVFVDTYTHWCGWCKKMDATTFSNPEVAEYVNKNYYAIKLNAEGSKKLLFNGQSLTEAQLASSFKVSGYPTIVFIDEKFQNVTPVPGYQGAKDFLQILKEFNAIKQEDETTKKGANLN